MHRYIGTKLNVDLISASTSTVRTWLLIANLVSGHGSPLIASFAELSEASRGAKPISRRSISSGIAKLQELGMITCERRGNVSVIALVDADA